MAECWVPAEQLREGDAIDLEPILLDFPCDCETHQLWAQAAQAEYQVVSGLDRETSNCVRIDLEGAGSYGVPPTYLVFVSERA